MGRGPVGAPAIIRYVNNSLASVDDVSGIDDSMVLIKTLTASSDSTLSFVHGSSDVVLDSTYRTYIFKFINKLVKRFINFSLIWNASALYIKV